MLTSQASKGVFNTLVTKRAMSTISSIRAREIIDSRGNPTVEADVQTSDGNVYRAAVPSGASTGIYEALELRDKDEKRFLGKGCLKACENVNTIINAGLKGMDVTKQEAIDTKMSHPSGVPAYRRAPPEHALPTGHWMAARAAGVLEGDRMRRVFVTASGVVYDPQMAPS